MSEAQIARLQAFLMDGPRRYLEPSAPRATAEDCLAAAAALDYAKLIASGAAAPSLTDPDAAASLHEILRRAARAAIELLRSALDGPPARFADFVVRYGERDGVLSTLRAAGDLDNDLAFTMIATLSDIAELRAARAL